MVIIIAIVFLVSFCWFVWAANHAPEGYEDDSFHYGPKPE